MTKIERVYNVPLRERTQYAPKYKRAKKCVNVLREFIEKHMKCDNVKLGNYINEYIWRHGIKNFPHHIEVKAIKETKKVDNKEITIVEVELINLPTTAKRKEDKKQMLKDMAEKKKRKPKKEEEKEEMTEEQKEEKATQEAISKNEAPSKKVVRKIVKKDEEKQD
jgi:ribosomal protein L31E